MKTMHVENKNSWPLIPDEFFSDEMEALHVCTHVCVFAVRHCRVCTCCYKVMKHALLQYKAIEYTDSTLKAMHRDVPHTCLPCT
jgi:hypothetical protein